MALFRGLTAVIAAGVSVGLAVQSVAAQAPATTVPSSLDLAHNTPSGNYLAARTARGLPISFPGTTGVPAPMTGGRIVEP